MLFWRLLVGLVLALVYLPLAWPAARLLSEPGAWAVFADVPRFRTLLGNSAALAAGTLALCGPAGIALALLSRTDMPGRKLLWYLLLLTLFIPLPLFTSGWQAVLGAGGWWAVPAWSGLGGEWTPWGQGIGSAVWIHALAGLPWVVLMVEPGLGWVEREVEESALLDMPGWRVLLTVTLPRARAAVAAALLWVAVQTLCEITVTDVMQVRTIAEEVYTQMVLSEGASGIARTLAVFSPILVLGAGLVLLAARSWERSVPPAEDVPPPRTFALGIWRWPLGALALLTCLALLVVPLGGLVWRAGLSRSPPSWMALEVVRQVSFAVKTEGQLVTNSLLLSLTCGLLGGGLGLLICWVSYQAPRFRALAFCLLALACVTPGPVIGLGLKGLISDLLDATKSPFLARYLWYGPSNLPLVWVHLMRFLPCAVALAWPVLRLVPPEWRDLARVDGATSGQELRYVFLPLALPALARAVAAVGVLGLGELSAGKLVSTPQTPGYAEVVFAQMHYGLTPGLAAQCLLLLGAVVGALLLAGGVRLAWALAGRLRG